MKTSKPFFTAFFFTVVALGTVNHALAIDATVPDPIPFAAFDLNQDGVISPDELSQVRAERQAAVRTSGRLGRNMASAPAFEQIDTNRDGEITLEERTAFLQNRSTALGGRIGRNANAVFTAFDLNADGVVTPDELTEMRAKRQAAVKASGRLGRNMASAPTFEQIDANGDGEITLEEHTAFRLDRRSARGGGMGRNANACFTCPNNTYGQGMGVGRGNGKGGGKNW